MSVGGRPVYAFVQDKTVEKAAFTASHGKKICALYDSALKAGAPVVGVFSGAGAKISEGIDCLSAYGSVMAKISEAKALIPQIAVIIASEDIFTLATYYRSDTSDKDFFFPSEDWKLLPDDNEEPLKGIAQND